MIVVVDSKPDDYQGWNAAAETSGARLQFVASATEALRLSRTTPVDLWVINATLPGLGGCELCSLIRDRHPQATIFLAADEYSETVERQAWQARATLFGVKPAQAPWLNECLRAHRFSLTAAP